MIVVILMSTLFFIGVLVGVGLTSLLSGAAYDDGYMHGFLDAGKSPPFLLSQDTRGPGEDLSYLLYERTP